MTLSQPIISKPDFLLVPTDKSEIKYIWGLLDQWGSGCVWKSMYKDYVEFEEDILLRIADPRDMLWTCWTKQGRISKKFGVIMLTDITYGLSAEIHGIADKKFYEEEGRKKHPLTDKAFRAALEYCFNALGVARVNGTFYEDNPLLTSFLRRHGFRRNALLKKAVYINSEIHDKIIFGLTEDDFLKGEQYVIEEKT